MYVDILYSCMNILSCVDLLLMCIRSDQSFMWAPPRPGTLPDKYFGVLDFGEGVPLTLGVFYAFLGFYNRNVFSFLGVEPADSPKIYDHDTDLFESSIPITNSIVTTIQLRMKPSSCHVGSHHPAI